MQMMEDDTVEMEGLNQPSTVRQSSKKQISSVSSKVNIYRDKGSTPSRKKQNKRRCCKSCSCVKIALLGQTLVIIALLVISKWQPSYSQEIKVSQTEKHKPAHVSNYQGGPGTVEQLNKGITVVNQSVKQIITVPKESQKHITTPTKINPSSTTQPIKVPWPSTKSDYDISDSFNLWEISVRQKTSLLKRYKALPQNKKPRRTDNFMEINYDKDSQFQTYAKQFQQDIEIIEWNDIKLGQSDKNNLLNDYSKALSKRQQNLQKIIKKYKAEYMGKSGYIKQKKKIEYQQFLQNLQYEMLTGQDFKTHTAMKKIYQREKEYHQKKYKVHQYPGQLHACIIVPTYNNQIDHRYVWHLQSIFQQDYHNYRMIIIDDYSADKTSPLIARYLKWRQFPKQKAILIRNLKHRTALQNIYYGIHKYCDYNQMSFIIDGDDEIVGTQVFRLYNAIYQQKKSYVLYSNFFSYDSKNQTQPIVLGLSEDYPLEVKKQSSYRKAYHAYSHLRTMMTDLFLLQRVQSLKDPNKKFYWTIYDNAMYFPALQMSCGRVEYLPELKYWYTANTGFNDWRTKRQSEYMAVKNHIANTQRHYHCINSVFKMIKEAVDSHQTNP